MAGQQQGRALEPSSPTFAPRLLADEQVLAALAAWSLDAQHAFSPHTQQAWRSDWKQFSYYCFRLRQSALPAMPWLIARYVNFKRRRHRSLATIRRHVATLARAHKAAGLTNPCADGAVELALKATARLLGREQKQARGLIWAEIQRFMAMKPLELRDHRDRALVMLAYDTMCRSEEIVAVDDGSIDYLRSTLFIPKSKSDQEREGAYVYLSPFTLSLLDAWIERAAIKEGAVFRVIHGKARIGERLKPKAVASVFRRVGLKLQLPWAEVRGLSGHSARVGATQDQLGANIAQGLIQQSGRWSDPRMVARYGKHLAAQRSAAAQLAELQGRASIASRAFKR